jgi:PIN domain nuclease of toxin-antitoxin system
MIAAYGFVLLPITLPHLAQLGRLPLHHRDPFDRLLAAQAMVERVGVITGDRRIARYGVRIVWSRLSVAPAPRPRSPRRSLPAARR